ncbi:MAG TPA: hypothetical protein G4O18_09465 [Dehalococcoidia bacterium]|nr:hypothetical protein [Dehalococcoidia bacterium]
MSIDDLRREAEEVKERVKRDIFEFRDILRKMSEEIEETGRPRVNTLIRRAERRIEETAEKVESHIDHAISIMVGPSAGKRNVVTREMDFSDFTNVEVGSCFRVEIKRADSHHVTIAGDENFFDYVNVAKSGNTLKLSIKPLTFIARPNLQASITMPKLNKLRLGGAATCTVSDFRSDDAFALNLSGSSVSHVDIEAGKSRVEISGASRLRGNMKLADAEFTLSGASRAELGGSANNVVLSAWGASRLDLTDFVLNDTSINLKGASEAAVTVNGKLDMDLSSGSRLCYSGNPTMGKINVSGASTLSQR